MPNNASAMPARLAIYTAARTMPRCRQGMCASWPRLAGGKLCLTGACPTFVWTKLCLCSVEPNSWFLGTWLPGNAQTKVTESASEKKGERERRKVKGQKWHFAVFLYPTRMKNIILIDIMYSSNFVTNQSIQQPIELFSVSASDTTSLSVSRSNFCLF